ncbi:MAG: ATP synthase subunit b [Parcubacteria group bacterium GW2011_GWF2_45_11]|nr:MAG: ATP synthase subunit b [Parcubacteria group bacterium GW2011_GWF2_45_11]
MAQASLPAVFKIMLIQLLIINVLIFAGLILFLRFIFSRGLNTAVTKLNQLQEENSARESQLNEELRRAREESDAQIKRGKEEAEAVIEEAKKEGMALRLKIEEEARSQAEKIILQTKEEAKKFRESAQKDIENQALGFAVELIKNTFTGENNTLAHKQFVVNEVIEEIARIPKERFSSSVDTVRIISALPLDGAARDSLKEILSRKLEAFDTKEETDNGLICGLVVEMRGLVVDGSLRNRLNRAMSYLKK